MKSLKFKIILIIFGLLLWSSQIYASTIGKPTNFLTLNTGLVGWWTFDGKSTSIGAGGAPQVTFLTSGTSWTVPADWNNSNNTIEVIGGGAGGYTNAVNDFGGGGGGGGYSKITNLSLTPSASVAYAIGSGGAAKTDGGDSYFCNSSSNCASIAGTAVQVGAKGGATATSLGVTGGVGGAAASGVGTTKNSGGNGGSGVGGMVISGGGGGGAAGPNGNGATGGAAGANTGGGGGGGADNGSVGTAGNASTGGAGGNGRGGTGGGAAGAPPSAGTVGGGGGGGDNSYAGAVGGSDTEFDASHGSGGGGGGAGNGTAVGGRVGGEGALYGGGGGGGGYASGAGGAGGAGKQGIIVITYTSSAGAMTTNDLSGNGNTGTLTNMGQSSVVGGKTGQALNFDGSNDYVNVPDSVLSPTDHTVSLWLKANVVTSGDTDYAFGNTNDVNGNRFYMTRNGSNLECRLDNGSAFGSTAITVGKWYFMVLLWEGTTGRCYVNGVLADTQGSIAFDSTIANKVSIGSYEEGSSSENIWNGSIDDVRVYNRALSAAEIKQLYNLGAAAKVASTPKGLPTQGMEYGLTGHWSFDGKDTVSRIEDVSGNGNHGYLKLGSSGNTATSSMQKQGKIGQGFFFDGIDDWIEVNREASTFMSAATGTIAAWAYIDTPNASYECSNLGGEAIVTDALNQGYFELGAGRTQWCAGAASPNTPIYSSAFTVKKWTHLIWTHGNGYQYLYVDGALANSGAFGNISSLTSGLAFGRSYQSVFFSGGIDDIRMYNRYFSANDVKQLYNMGAATKVASTPKGIPGQGLSSGLVGHWTFDGPKMITNVADSSGNSNNGSLIGQTSTTTVPGKLGQALSFDGVNDYVNLGTPANLEIQLPITISGWFKQTVSSPTYQPIYGAYSSLSSGLSSLVRVDSGVLKYYTSTEPDWIQSVGTLTVSLNQWHFFAVVVSGSIASPTVTIYLDGNSESSALGALDSTMSTTIPIYIGSDYAQTGTELFKGSIDDIRVHSRALSAGEITQLYNMGR